MNTKFIIFLCVFRIFIIHLSNVIEPAFSIDTPPPISHLQISFATLTVEEAACCPSQFQHQDQAAMRVDCHVVAPYSKSLI